MPSLVDLLYNLAGHVSPSQAEAIKQETARGIEKASRGASPAVIAERQRQAAIEIDGVLRSNPGGSAHPEDAGLSVLKSVGDSAKAILLLGSLALGGYFLFRFFKVVRAAR